MCGLIGDSRRRRSVKDMRRRAENGDAPRGSHYDVTILELANDHYDNEVHVRKHSYIGQSAAWRGPEIVSWYYASSPGRLVSATTAGVERYIG